MRLATNRIAPRPGLIESGDRSNYTNNETGKLKAGVVGVTPNKNHDPGGDGQCNGSWANAGQIHATLSMRLESAVPVATIAQRDSSDGLDRRPERQGTSRRPRSVSYGDDSVQVRFRPLLADSGRRCKAQ